MRDAVEGKVNGARINIPAWMEVDGERRRSRGGRKEGRKEGRKGGRREKKKESEVDAVWREVFRFYSREGPFSND